MNVRHRPRAHRISVIGNFREAKPHRVARAHFCYASETVGIANMSALATTEAQWLNFEDVNVV
jgi:hypothetical protein